MRHRVFSDFDQFVDSIQGVDMLSAPRGVSEVRWETKTINLGQVLIQWARKGSGSLTEGVFEDKGQRMIYLPLTPGVGFETNGQTVTRGNAILCSAGAELVLSSYGPYDWIAFEVPLRVLTLDLGTDDLVVDGAQRPRPRVEVKSVAPGTLAAIETFFAGIDRASALHAGSAKTPAATHALADLLCLLRPIDGSGVAEQRSTLGRPAVDRTRVIRMCQALLELRGTEPVLVPEMAQACGVSDNTLRSVFKSYYGVAPATYLQQRQLANVRKDLRKAAFDEATVTEVLCRHGVWEFGRFAGRYRKTFGELPSDTLRERGRAIAVPPIPGPMILHGSAAPAP